jgi:pimeloyl-ACP methyl ester carboxylesterase
MKRILAVAFAVSVASGCGSQSAGPTSISMDFARSSFYDAPFPSEDLRTADGHVDLSKFPGQAGALVAQQAVSLIESDDHGFSTTAGVFFEATASIDPTTLPNLAESTADAASVYLMDADPTSPTYQKKIPVDVSFDDDGGPFGAQHQITVLPYQGVPLRPLTRYAAVITDAVRDALGRPLVASGQMTDLLAGHAPGAMSPAAAAEYQGAIAAIGDTSSVVGLAVYRTDDPLAGMRAVLADAMARPIPTPDAPLQPNEVFPDYCVYSTTIEMPDYQSGIAPYAVAGGVWKFDAQGKPIFQEMQKANVVVTLPRQPMPPNGFPTVVFSRTGAGGDRPLVDRGVQPATGQPAITPGTGPALEFARAGFAGISIDGPLGGLRNPTGDPNQEDFLIFNISNPGAIRDNIRQSAMELALTAHILDGLTVDASACPTLANASVKFDVGKLALMGHSMGATIAPLAAAFEPRFGAVVLSGCGGSYIENVLYKEKPLLIRPLAEVLVGYPPIGRHLTEGDPVLSLIQWAAEASDPPVYGPLVLNGSGAPHHVLMFQGIVDHYILPPMANASTLSFGLDLAGPELDIQTPELADYTPLGPLLAMQSRAPIPLPAQDNVSLGQAGSVTAVVTQAPSDGVEDGHEAMFQTQGPKYQYRCFLASYAKGGPVVVPVPQDSDALCPLN